MPGLRRGGGRRQGDSGGECHRACDGSDEPVQWARRNEDRHGNLVGHRWVGRDLGIHRPRYGRQPERIPSDWWQPLSISGKRPPPDARLREVEVEATSWHGALLSTPVGSGWPADRSFRYVPSRLWSAMSTSAQRSVRSPSLCPRPCRARLSPIRPCADRGMSGGWTGRCPCRPLSGDHQAREASAGGFFTSAVAPYPFSLPDVFCDGTGEQRVPERTTRQWHDASGRLRPRALGRTYLTTHV